MIFVTVGSQKFQFNSLLQEIDHLIDKGIIRGGNVFAQIGYSTYKPKKYLYKEFLNKEEFLNEIDRSEIVISHGGTGSIINSIKKEKKVIAVPRSVNKGEHVDNHQYEIIHQFMNSNLILGVSDVSELETAFGRITEVKFKRYQSNTENIINIIEKFIKIIN